MCVKMNRCNECGKEITEDETTHAIWAGHKCIFCINCAYIAYEGTMSNNEYDIIDDRDYQVYFGVLESMHDDCNEPLGLDGDELINALCDYVDNMPKDILEVFWDIVFNVMGDEFGTVTYSEYMNQKCFRDVD